ncbi:hypothetical protein [Herminiimonas arsenitoxidans]|uniref:hypothetical protein n=1 Tax=Herminiimonas arsenitoxidans TaxID=1809410 RepID=UPI000970C7BC|nr:hypothetical protein [Herminiimonas arsenitoxidans]
MDTKTTPATKPIEIFKPGSYVAMNGKRYTYTAADVADMAASYDPKLADAPFVVGHPKLTSPRYGHAARLFINDAGVLCAEGADVAPEFAQAVADKHYPKVSASIYEPDAAGNPSPGKHYIRHIGFLGGVAPAVKGLASVEFSEGEEGIADFAYEDRLVVRMFRSLREFMIETFGVEKTDRVLPNWDIESLESSATRDEIEGDTVRSFAAPIIQQENQVTTEAQKALEAREQTVATREAELVKQLAALKKTQHADFAETLVAGGLLLPAHKDAVVEIIAQLDAADQVADFAEGTEHHGKTGAALFKEFLSVQPKQVEFSRVSKAGGDGAGVAEFAAPAGQEVDQEGLLQLGKINAYMDAHPGTSFIAAATAVEAAA